MEQELIKVLTEISETLQKMERNQRYFTKVVTQGRDLTLTYAQASALSREDVEAFGGKLL